jgi:hypothetical protein
MPATFSGAKPATATPTVGNISIGVSAAQPATYDETGYEALTFTHVAGPTVIPDIGSARNDVNFDDVATGSLIKARGQADPGGGEFRCSDMPTDPGQVLLKAAHDAGTGSTDEQISVVFQSSDNTGVYFTALVSAWRKQHGGSDDVRQRLATMNVIPGTVVEF